MASDQSDPQRIDETIDVLRRVWHKYPDLRLGQLLFWATQAQQPCPQIFYADDDKVLQKLQALENESSEIRKTVTVAELMAMINDGRL